MLNGVIYVVLPVHDRRAQTERFISLLREQTDQGFRLVLVDDGSVDGTADGARRLLPEAVVLTGDGSLWWGGSLQLAYRWILRATHDVGDIVLIANDDTVFEPEFLATGRRVLSEHPRSLVLARLHGPDWQLKEVGVRTEWAHLRLRPVLDPSLVNCFSTRGLLLTVADFLVLGGFHPRLLPHYASDYEFTIRARRRGFDLVSDPALRVMHEVETRERTQERGLRAFLRARLSKRSHANPIYWTTFLALSCPPLFLPVNVARVWGRFFLDLIRAVGT